MELYSDMENQIIGDIARRIRNTGRLTETAELQAEILKEQGYSPAHILAEVRKTLNSDQTYMAEVAQNTMEYKKMVSDVINRTVENAKKAGDYLVSNAGMMSYRDDLRIWNEHGVNLRNANVLSQLIKAYTEQTMGNMRNLTMTTGAMELNGVKLQNAYRHELDLTIIKTVSGGFSFNKALDDCCHNLARNGLKIVYPSGKKMNLESAARMCLKTGISQLSGKITEANIKKTGTRLVYVSAHAGARPEHAVWQGKVYTYDGKTTSEYPDFFDATDYGSVTGLKGVNCSHEFYPHWEGDTIPVFKEPEPREYNGKEYTFYEATQEQRKMERKARELKSEIKAQKAVNNDKKVAELEKELKQNENKYNSFSRTMGLRPKTERMEIYNPKSSKGNRDKGGGLIADVNLNLMDSKIKYNKPERLKNKLSDEEIIDKLGRRDWTKGSCTSQAMAYLGNKYGYDVVDYVGGKSMQFFRETDNIVSMANIPGVDKNIITSDNEIEAAKKLLNMVVEGKEYLLSVGEHTAVVKKEDGKMMYLELQAKHGNNDFYEFNDRTLVKRFKCKEETKDDSDNILIDAESLAKSEDFQYLLGYINRSNRNGVSFLQRL